MQTISIPEDYFNFSKDLLVFSSKFCGIREIQSETIFNNQKNELLNELKNDCVEVKLYFIDEFCYYFILKKLNWDSDFFQRPMYKLLTILSNKDDYKSLERAVNLFTRDFAKEAGSIAYCSIELPSESNLLIQALTTNKFRLVETRLHHYLKDIQKFDYNRFQVRSADETDSENLALVASQTRNKYDRFHADVMFENDIADQYLGRFAKETVNGLADKVFVPDETGIQPNALFAVNLLKDEWTKLGSKVSQLVLAASDPMTNKGWYEKLLSEVCYYLKDNNVDFLITNTQTTNKSPIHVNEKLGFKYSHTTHILTISNGFK